MALAVVAGLLGVAALPALSPASDRTAMTLPSAASAVAPPGPAALVLLARSAREGDEGTTSCAFGDGEGAVQPLGGPTDVYLAALRVLSDDPGRPFRIKADARLPWRQVEAVIEQLRKAGVREITLITRHPSGAGR